MKRQVIVALMVSAMFALGMAAPAGAATVRNGGFETGDLSFWDEDYFPQPNSPIGSWEVYPVAPRGGVFAPPEGQAAAATFQGGPSGQIISQVVKLAPNRKHRLSFQFGYALGGGARGKGAPGFWTPDTFALGRKNQQFRMDVVSPGAPIKSLKAKDVLAEVHRTERGDPESRPFRKITGNLTRFAGRRVRLRFATITTEQPFFTAIDAVKIASKR